MSRYLIIAAVLSTIFCIPKSLAADDNLGEKLHQQQCLSCHGTEVYTRSHLHVTSLSILHQQVKRCEMPSDVHWSNEEVMSVVNYLNSHFYHFPTP